ncbi:hypothetical protein SAMN05216338_1006162 [Bradyrhizobium sp. Rc2d]|uniref:hypothetical protein n=1 Tax=Bradyrhizobium sp. Rc2d TaxID=1855321 RepID=UPI00088DC360|nr:hypothetical protein [Bradyrhizobium sp. Rc2d]SDH20430.1 hypothetical protein SAMN05216338_1006162 [Bradyrhizobium sp. Rc2d]
MSSNRNLLARAGFALLGTFCFFWSVAVLLPFRLTASTREVSARILADDRFRPGVLADLLARLNAAPRLAIEQPEYLQAEALIALRVAEEVVQRRSSENPDSELQAADEKIRSSLSISPSDPFLWFLSYSLKTVRIGFDLSNLKGLEQSYVLGPREGWIAVRRNRVALSAFGFLRPSLQQSVVSEFMEMVDADFIDDAAINLERVGWLHRDQLLSGLSGADIASREKLARRVSQDGAKVSIPGVQENDRPWR